MKKINWNEVDEFPTTIECDSISEKKLRKQCFFDFMSQQLHLKLANDTIREFYKNQDTLRLKITVTPDSQIIFESQFTTDSLSFDRNKADSLLQTKLINFSSIEPAIKRGMKVKSEFIIPVVIKKKS